MCACDEGEWLRKLLLSEERVLEPGREVRLRLVPLAWRWNDGDLWDEAHDGLDMLHVFGLLEGFEALTIVAPKMPADNSGDDARVDPAPPAATFSFDSVLGGAASRAPRGGVSRGAGGRGASRSDGDGAPAAEPVGDVFEWARDVLEGCGEDLGVDPELAESICKYADAWYDDAVTSDGEGSNAADVDHEDGPVEGAVVIPTSRRCRR